MIMQSMGFRQHELSRQILPGKGKETEPLEIQINGGQETCGGENQGQAAARLSIFLPHQ
jgi:hypothetical protein